MTLEALQPTPAALLELLRLTPLPQAIPWLLAQTGGSFPIAELFKISSSPKTILNVLGLLEKKGIIKTNGAEICLPEPMPETCPMSPRDLPEPMPDVSPRPTRETPDGVPETYPMSPRDLPDDIPEIGQAVNDNELEKSAELSPLIIEDILKREEDKELKTISTSKVESKLLGAKTKKPEKPEPGKRTPAARALPSWESLQQKEDFKIPDWLNLTVWHEWLGHLQAKKVEATMGTLRTHLKLLEKLRNAQIDQGDAVERAIARGWQTIGELGWHTEPPPKTPLKPRVSGKPYVSASDILKQLEGQESIEPDGKILDVEVRVK